MQLNIAFVRNVLR